MSKGMGDMGSFMRDAQKQVRDMQKRMEDLETSLKDRVVEGTSGGGMVKALVNGHQDIVAVKISKEVVDPTDVEMLEDLVTAACSQGLKKARELREQEMQKIAGGVKIPGLF
jgi:nucleoid-associated protein EbfC